MQERSEIIVPYSPLDSIFDSYRNDEECWRGSFFYGRHGNQDRHLERPKWNVSEVEKTAEIKDNFDFLRFKVYLYATNQELDSLTDGIQQPVSKKMFEVSTTSFIYNNEEQIIFTSEPFEKLEDAQACYDENVRRYSMIARVETLHYQDIRIYADKIGYKRVEKCCGKCRWCKMKHIRQHGYLDRRHRPEIFICTNFKLFADRLSDIDKPDYDPTKIRPEVHLDCVCNFFEKMLPPDDPKFKNHCFDQYGDDLLPPPPPEERHPSSYPQPPIPDGRLRNS